MQRLKTYFNRSLKGRTVLVTRVEVSGDGFVAWKADESAESVRWTEIEWICTYKIDCYTVDMICLAFGMAGQDEIQVQEQAEGFVTLIGALNNAFLGIDREWYQRVMLPPFAENFTILYRRTQET